MFMKNNRIVGIANPVNTAIFLFLCVAIISIPTAAWPGNAVQWLIDLLKRVALFLLIIGLIDTKDKMRAFIWVFIILIAWVAWTPFWDAMHGKFGSIDYTFGKFYRSKGTSFADDPNTLASTLVQTIPFAYFLLITEKPLKHKLILIAIIALLLYTIILTASRTGVIGLFVFITLLLIRSKRKASLMLLIAILFIFTLSLLNQQQKQRYISIFSSISEEERDSSSQLRINAWSDGISLFLDRPITGWGIGCYSPARGRKFGHFMWPHNLYIQLISELGIAGLVTFFLILYYIFKNIYHTRRLIKNANMTSDWYYHLTHAMEFSLVIRLVIGIFGHSLYHYIWYFVAGVSVVMLHLAKNETNEQIKWEEYDGFIRSYHKKYDLPSLDFKEQELSTKVS
jgi:O-antigen ligase